MMKSYYLLVLVFCASQAHLLTSNLCSRYCKDNKNLFNYKLGYSYEYKYTGSINSLVYGNVSKQHESDNPSFTANFKIHVLSPCDFEMEINSVEVNNGEGKHFEKVLTEHPLQFSFQNGKIGTICPVVEENVAILNVKRGILSSFQTNFEDDTIFETDISGTCETRYEVLENRNIKKTKDLTSCNKRSTKQFSWHSEIYDKNQARFSSPLLKSTQSCVQEFRENILRNVDCVEKHLFRPFSNDENGAATVLKQQLRFIKSHDILNKQTKQREYLHTSLIFEKEPPKKLENYFRDTDLFEKLMHEIEAKSKNGIQKEVLELFSKLVNIVENSKQDFLLGLFQKIKKSSFKKKFFVDAISVTRTIESIWVMKKLYEEKEISHQLFNSWIISVGLIKNPSKEFIYSLGDLLDLENSTKQKVYLSISGLIHQYCKNSHCDDEFVEVLEKISEPIQHKCVPKSPGHQEEILLSLKAMGNSGHHHFGKYLKQCYLNSDVPIDLKIAAIQGHRRISCDRNQNVRDFENIFSNFQENSEVRINSYLAMMRCSSYSTFEKIKYVLNEEETNQVGSFVWSHLVNLQKTETFWKQDLKKLIENDNLKNKFSTDPRKYSRNYEGSTYFDQIDTGVGLESNVIFTQESYLPKSAMLNFTIDIFGETVNLFEIGARMEGFEDIVENMFGPNGYFPEKSIKTFLENQRYEHQVSSLKIDHNYGLKKSPTASLYTKLFGHEISFTKFEDLEELLGKPTDANSLLHAIMIFFKEIDFTKSVKFLDAKYEVPTILGFPLELSANGTAILGLTTKGKVNLKEIKEYKFDVEGKISPSSSIKVTGSMEIDAFFTKIGLKSVSALNSNTFIEGSIKIDQGKLVDIKINAPKTDVDIINIESDIFFIKDDQTYAIQDISTDGINRSDCTSSYFEQLTGLQICHNLKFVNASSVIDAPYFPFTGSFKYSITAKKTDTFDAYILKWTSQKNYEQGIYGFSFDLDTPRSSTNRKLNAFFLLDISEKILELKMSSQFVSFDLLGKIDLDPKKFLLSLRHTYNGDEILNFQALLKYITPKYDLNATFDYKKNQLFLLRGHLTPTSSEIISKFHVKIKKKHYIFDSTLKIKEGSYNLSSLITDGHTSNTKGNLTVQILHDLHTFSLVANSKYNLNAKDETFSLILNTWKGATLDYRKHGFYLKFESSQKPEYNTLIDLETRKAHFHYDLKGIVSIFGKKWETRQLLKLLKDHDKIDASIVSSLSCPDKNIDYIFTLAYNTSRNQNFANAKIQLNTIQRLEMMFDLKKENNGDRIIETLLYIPRNSFRIKGEIKNIVSDEYSIKLIGEQETVTKEVFLKVDGIYSNSTENNLQNYSINGTFDPRNGFLKTPWNFKVNFQIIDDFLAINVDIEASKNKILTQLSWMENSFGVNFELNNKKMFFANVRWNHEVNFVIGLNVYQHFEMNVTFQPKTKMDFIFYWDKNVDLTRKFSLHLQNFGRGVYTMELEYPNQKITTSFTLQSTQITLNITWGIETYRKIYLNVGSKVYDLGGIWYGELETPFKYFEKQHFNIKYLIMQNLVNVEIKVFWREHKIDLGVSGSRSSSHIDAKLEMITTLPEIYKVGLGVSYIERSSAEMIENMANISMIYNQHQIDGYNQWKKTAVGIDGNFKLFSPSGTMKPILGNLEMRNNETNSHMNVLISWQEKEIVLNYKVDSTRSLFLMKTPFEGIEKTKLQCYFIRTINDLLIEIEIDVLNQLNYAFLRWSNEYNNTYNVEFEITSRVTGRYQLFFKHSTHHGYLMENIIVNHGENNNTIFGIQINGNVVSVWDIDLHWSMKFLNHNATLSIQNGVNPFRSNVEARWDNLTILSNFEVVFTPYKLDKAFWSIKSSVLEEDFEIVYTSFDKYRLTIKIPKNFAIENELEILNNNIIDHFIFKTPKHSGKLIFRHTHQNNFSCHEHLKLIFDTDELTGDLKYKFDEFAIFDHLNAKIRSTWNDHLDFDYTLNQDLTTDRILLQPQFFLRRNNESIQGRSNFEMSAEGFSINLHVNGTNITSFTLNGQGNRKENNFDLQVKSDVIEGHVSLNTNKNNLLINLKSNLSESQLLLKVHMDDERPFEMYFKSNIKDWENIHLRLIKIDDVSDFRKGIITLKKNNETTTLNYRLNKLSYDGLKINVHVNVSSTTDYLNNSLLIVDTDYTKIYLKAKVHVYKTEIGYVSDYKDTPTGFENKLKIVLYFGINEVKITDIHFDAKTMFGNQDDKTAFYLNLIGNKSKLDVELSKINWQGLSLKVASILDEDTFIDTSFNYELIQKKFRIFCDTKSSFGDFHSKIEITEDAQKLKKIVTHVEYKKGDVEYLGKITTKYNNIFWSDSELEFNLSKEIYKGNLKVQIGDVSNSFIASLSSPNNSNKIECILNVYSVKKANGIFDFHLDVFETTSNKFTFDYDMESNDKKFAFNYHPDMQTVEAIKLQLTLNRSHININLDLPHQKKYFYLNGKNFFKDREVNLVYEFKYGATSLKVDVFYINKNYTQTKLETSSNIKGYERIIFENRIDNNKVRIFIHSKYHRLQLIADKIALYQDKELFSIYYNSEPLIIIRSGSDQTYLMAASKYINYKLTVNYVHDPAIYTFSLLKNGENLISFMLLNTTTSKLIHFKGKLAAPVLFAKNQELSFNINANYDISKLLQFTITSDNKNLFEIKWNCKLENGLYEAYFKYSSEIPWMKLKKFEIHPSLNMWNDFRVKVNFVENGKNLGYFAELAIPMTTLDTKFVVEYPCLNHQCNYNFYINRTFVAVNWLLPLQNMNNLKFVVNLNKYDVLNLLSGGIIFEKDGNNLEAGWLFNVYDDDNHLINIYLNSDQNRQDIYYNNNRLEKTLRINLESFKSSFNFKKDLNELIEVSFSDEITKTTIDLNGFISEKIITFTLNNSAIVTNLTINKEDNFEMRINSGFVADHKILNNGDDHTLFNKLITLTQFLTVPFVGKDIGVKIIFEKNQNLEANLTITTGYNREVYSFKKSENKLLLTGPTFKINGIYEKLCQFSLEGLNKTLNLKFHRKENYVDAQVLIDDNSTLNINLYYGYTKIKNTYTILTNLPISLTQFIRSNLILSLDSDFSLRHEIFLPNSDKVLITSQANENLIDLHVISTLTGDYHATITRKINNEVIHLIFFSSRNNENLTATLNIIPYKELSIILHTPYPGFISAMIEAKFDDVNKKAYLKILRETQSLNLEGSVNKKSLRITNLNNEFLLNLNYDLKNYRLELKTPFGKIKNLKLSGIYAKKDNNYNLEGNGTWDGAKIIFGVNLNLEPENFKLNSKIDVGNSKGDLNISISKNKIGTTFVFSAYYPEESSKVFFGLKSQFDDSNLTNDLNLITSFDNLKNVSISLIKKQNDINFKTLGNLIGKDVLIDVTSKIYNNTLQVNSNIILLDRSISSELFLDIFRTSYFKMGNFFVQYDIENKYLFKIMFVDMPFVLEIIHQDEKGEIFAQVQNVQLETVYTMWKKIKCNLKNNFITFDVYVSKNNFKFLRKHLTGHILEVTYLNNPQEFKLGFTDSSYDLTYSLGATKNLGKLIFQFEKLVFFLYDHNDEDKSLIFQMKDYLETKFNSSKVCIQFNARFPKTNDVSIFGKLHREKLFAETIFTFRKNHENLIHFKEFHDSKKMGIAFEFDKLHVKLNHEYQHSKTTVRIKREPDEISYEFSDLGDLRFLMKSPSLENNGFQLSLNVKLPLNVTFYMSSINNNVFTKFQSYVDSNCFYLDFQAPHNKMFNLIQFKTIWGRDIFKTLNNVKIESGKLGNISIIGNFDLKHEGLDIETHLKLPFLENFENLDGEVHIHKNLTPWFYVTLPNNKTYSVKAIYINEQKLFKIDLGFHLADKIYGFKIDYQKDNSLIFTEIKTPFDGYKHYGFSFEKDNNIHFGTLNINDRIYKLNTRSTFTSKSQVLTVHLETPFKNYEKYYFEIQHEDSIFNCFVYYPGLKRMIGFGFNSKIQFGVSFKISLPHPVHGFEYSAFEIKIIPKENGVYNISASSELNDKYIKLDFSMKNNDSYIYSILETNNNTIVYKMYDLYENYIVYNDNYIYNFNFYDSLHIYVDLYYKKLSFTYDTYVKNFQIKLWDSKNHENKYGCHFINYANDTSIGLYLPSKIIVIDQQHYRNATNFIYGIKIFWNEEKIIGFKGEFLKINTLELIDFHSNLNLFIPNREYVLTQHLRLNVKKFEPINGMVITNFKWDKNERSQINYKGILNDRHLESVFSAGFLDHDIIFRMDFTKLNELPFGFTLEIKYSSNKQKTIRIEMFYNKTYINNIMIDERRFVLKHPYSKLDHTLISKAVTSEKYTNVTAVIQYTDFTIDKPEFMKVSLEIGRKEFEISGAVESKKNSLLIYSKSLTDIYSKGLQLKLKINNKEPLNLNYLYVYKDIAPSFQLLTGYGDDRYYQFYMGIPNKKEISARLTHNIYGKETIDGLVILKLNTTSLLWTKILWKTNILRHFYKSVIEEYADLKYVVQATGRQLIDVVHDETGKILLQEYTNIKEVISGAVDRETREAAKDFEQLRRLCENNTLYCQDVATLWSNSVLGNVTTPIFDVIKDFYDNIRLIKNEAMKVCGFILNEMEVTFGEIKNIKALKEAGKDMLTKSIEEAKVSLKNMQNSATKLLEDFHSYLMSIKATADIIFKPALNLINEFWIYFEHQNTYSQIIVLDTMATMQTYVSHLKEVKDIVSIYNYLTTWVSSLNPIDFLIPLWDMLEIAVNTFISNINFICHEYIPSLSNLKYIIFDECNLTFPKIKDLKNFVEDAYQKLVWIWRYYNTTEVIKTYIATKTTMYFKMFIRNVFGNTKEGLGIFDYIYNPDMGVIEVSQRLPVEWEAFDRSPKFEQHPLYNHIFEKMSSFTLDKLESVLAKIQMFIYTILNTTIKPASNNMAMIIANNHFITFNNKHFDFIGNCSYLLINNFDTNSFSVVLNTGESTSLTITTYNDSATIHISDNAPIIFNSIPVEFPLIRENFYIHHDDDSILFGNYQGLFITCNVHYDYCTFKVSEWLFGKIGGMLGTMDNEPSTDMRKPNGSNIIDVDDFADSWRAGQCSHEKSAANIKENIKIPTFVNRAMTTICSQTFLISNSTLSSCFPILDPKPFYEMCLKGIKVNSRSVCSSIAAYKQMCNHKHVVVKMPDFCVNCNLNNWNNDFEGERIFDGHNQKTMDIVLIQEQGCFPDVDHLKHSLNEALNQKGFTQNRFSIVIYGGDILARPLSKTANGKIWTNITVSINNPTQMIQSTLTRIKSTVEEAIRYAAKLDFRPAVTKMFILVQCQRCSEMTRSPELYNLLGEKDTILHIIKPDPFESNGLLAIDSTKRRMNTKGVLTETSSNEKLIDALNDMCCGLALSTTGTVSKSEIFVHHTEKWAKLVAETARPCSCQKCKCVQKSNGVGRTDCNRCMSPLVKQLLNEYESQHVRL